MGDPKGPEITILNVSGKTSTMRGVPVTTNASEVDTARMIFDRTSSGARPDPTYVLNQSNALSVEVAARDWVNSQYGARAQVVAAIKRPGRKEIPVFDYLIQTGDKEFVLLEAKSHFSELSFTADKVLAQDPGGAIRALSLSEEVEQLSGKWIEQRISELRRSKVPGANNLAEKLNRSWRSGRLRVLLGRGVQNPLSTELLFEVLDYTDEANAYVGATPRHRIPAGSEVGSKQSGVEVKKGVSTVKSTPEQRVLLTQEAFLKGEFKEAGKRVTAFNQEAKYLDSKIVTAKHRVANTEGKLEELAAKAAKPNARPSPKTTLKLHTELAERQATLKRLEGEAAKARAAAKEAADEAKAFEGEIGKRRSEIYRLEAAKPPKPVRPPSGVPVRPASGAPGAAPSKAAPASDPAPAKATAPAASAAARADDANPNAALRKARGTLGTAVDERGLGGSGTIGELAESKGVFQAAERQLPKLAKAGRIRSVARFALKGSRVVMKAGKFVFRLVEFANPILDVLMLVGATDWLVGWLQREKKAEQAEWRRIAHLLSAPSQTVRLPPYNMPYMVAYGEGFRSLVERTLAGEYGRGNFLDWLQKWDNDPAWGGFVYATATGGFERQELQHSDDDEPYPVTYYPRGGPPLDVLLTDRPGPNCKKQGPRVDTVTNADERNLRTGGKEGSYSDPEHFVVVEISSLQVQYTYPDPVLTPFDYILAKCHALVAEIVAFLSKYDPQIMRDMDVRSEIIPGVASQNWMAGHPFEYPLYGDTIQWCLEVINNAIILLDRHRPIKGDERRPNPPQNFNAGYHRRLQMLSQLSKSAGPKIWSFQKIAAQLPAMLRDENRKYLVDSKDRSLDYLDRQHLYDVTWEIQRDVERALGGCQKGPGALEYNYESPLPAGR